MAYMMVAQRRTAEDVFEDVKNARRVCDPNLGYWVSLKEWEQHALGTEAAGDASAPIDAGGSARAEGGGAPDAGPPTGRKRSRTVNATAEPDGPPVAVSRSASLSVPERG